ncbi:rhomboid family intramembrane serine protease [Pseudonocardia acidicola]|uniref:rhomboid family intramembrane serine protease n=1 Tax=Pseudonocardia acidicola TaxID=2724939 RepID=UPI00308412CC
MGYQCVDCVAEGNRSVRRGTTMAGAEVAVRPIAVPALIALNAVVFVLTVAQAGSLNANAAAPLFQQWSLIPGLAANGQWWRVLTSGFLHYGPLHLLFNMMALWLIGKDLEMVLGRARFLAVYVVALLGGSAAVMVFYPPNAQVAGASGAVFGLMGGLAVVLRRLRAPMGQVIGLIAVNIVLSVVLPGVSLIGHLGGLVIGSAATAALVYAPARNRLGYQVGALVGLTVLLLAVIVGAAGLVL